MAEGRMIAKKKIDVRSVSITAAAALLRISRWSLQQDIRRGLPLVAGRLDLVEYGAWLNLELDRKRMNGS